MPILVRPQELVDVVAVQTVLVDAFADHGARVAGLADDLYSASARVALVAERDGDVVGSVMLSRSWLDAEPELVDVLVLSPLGVATEHQGIGVGSELVRAALVAAESMHCPLVFLEGEPDYYSRFDFVPGRQLGFTSPSARIPDRAFQVATLSSWQPWMTGALVYCDAFWQHDSVGVRSDHN